MARPVHAIDISPLSTPLRHYGRGAINLSELCDVVIRTDFLPATTLPGDQGIDVVETADTLHQRIIDSGAFETRPTSGDPLQSAVKVLVGVVLSTQRTVLRDLQGRHQEIDQDSLQRFQLHWALELQQFVEASPAHLRIERIGMLADHGLDHLLSTSVLIETIVATENLTEEEFGQRVTLGTNLVKRFIMGGDHQRAVTFAVDFGSESDQILLEAASALPGESPCWPSLMELIEVRRPAIIRSGNWTAVLYATAHVVACGHQDRGENLLALSRLNRRGLPPPDPDPWEQAIITRDTDLRIELLALTALIHHALGNQEESVEYAQDCADLSAEAAERRPFLEPDSWYLPKAAGWILAAAQRDPDARLLILKRAATKYAYRGALEARLALEAATTYLDLSRPELAAYFVAEAVDCASSRQVSDHFACSIDWSSVGCLLDVVRVTNQELDRATARLRRHGLLPEPETGEDFLDCYEHWYSRPYSGDQNLISPKPKRIASGK